MEDLKTRMDPNNMKSARVQNLYKAVYQSEEKFFLDVIQTINGLEPTQSSHEDLMSDGPKIFEYQLSENCYAYAKKDNDGNVLGVAITHEPIEYYFLFSERRIGSPYRNYNGPIFIFKKDKQISIKYSYRDNNEDILYLGIGTQAFDNKSFEAGIQTIKDSQASASTEFQGSLFDTLKALSEREDLTDEEKAKMEFIMNDFLVMMEPFGIRDEVPLSQEQLTINQLLKEKAALQKQLSEQTEQIAAKDEQIAAKDAIITEKDETIATQTAEITEKDETIATQAAEIAQKDEKISKLQAIKKELNRRLTALGDLFRSRAVLPSTKSQIEEILQESPTGQEPDDDDAR